MRKQAVTFEWQELDENQELPSIVEISASRPAANLWRQGSRLIASGGALCLLVAALLAAAWVERQAERGLAAIENELTLAVDAEAWQTRQVERSSSSLLDSAYSAQSQDEVLAVEVQALGRDVAAVTVVTRQGIMAAPNDDDSESVVYRQLRFYRQTEGGWQPTAPIPSLWGQPQSLATEYFDFTYRSRDADAVAAVAGELDALYAEMRRNFGLSPTPKQKIVVEVIIGPVPNRWAAPDKIAAHVFVASPALVAAPDSFSDASILRQSIALVLVNKLFFEAAGAHKTPSRWHSLLGAMRLWQIWDAGGLLAAWREPLLHWYFIELPLLVDDAAPLLPAAYAELCAGHGLWGVAPAHIGIPLYCHEKEDRAWVHLAFRFINDADRLTDMVRLSSVQPSFIYFAGYRDLEVQRQMQGRTAAVAQTALLDYVAATYGRDQIGALWPALHEHADWETLIPAVFGVTMDEFEAGWQAYLASFKEEVMYASLPPES